MQFRACFAGQDHQGNENLRESGNHGVHECVYLIEAENDAVLGSSFKLGGAAEHLIDRSEKRICRSTFEF